MEIESNGEQKDLAPKLKRKSKDEIQEFLNNPQSNYDLTEEEKKWLNLEPVGAERWWEDQK